MQRRHVATAMFTLALVAASAACGSTDDDTSTGAGVTATDTGQASAAELNEAGLNDADIEFAQGMIAHHEQAIEMAEIALDPNVGAGADVTDLATRIAAAQEPEVALMTGWLTAAGEPIGMDTSDGHDMSDMEGMMSVEQMDALAAATGPDFDRMWLEMMIAHHEGATTQSEAVIADGSNADVLAVAERIITTQQAEIAEMQQLLAG